MIPTETLYLQGTLTGTRFGDLDYTAEDVVTFEEGLIGFAGPMRFLILAHGDNTPFRWLQSLEEPALAFLVCDPNHFEPEYAPTIEIGAANALGLVEETPRLLFSTVRIPPGQPDEMTLNLAAPILVNCENRIGKQVVLEDGAYTMRHRVFKTEKQSRQAA